MRHQALVGERLGFLAAPQEDDGRQGHYGNGNCSHSISFDVPAIMAGVGGESYANFENIKLSR